MSPVHSQAAPKGTYTSPVLEASHYPEHQVLLDHGSLRFPHVSPVQQVSCVPTSLPCS